MNTYFKFNRYSTVYMSIYVSAESYLDNAEYMNKILTGPLTSKNFMTGNVTDSKSDLAKSEKKASTEVVNTGMLPLLKLSEKDTLKMLFNSTVLYKQLEDDNKIELVVDNYDPAVVEEVQRELEELGYKVFKSYTYPRFLNCLIVEIV